MPKPRTTATPVTAARGKRTHSRRLPVTVSLPALIDEDGGDSTFRQLLYDMAIATTHLDTARAFLARHLDVTPPQYNMLMVIAQADRGDGISVNEVAARLHVQGTFITAEVKKLVLAGFVEKQPNPNDARSVLLRLSAEATSRIHALKPELLMVNDHMFKHLPAEDFRHLARIFANLVVDFSDAASLLTVMTRNKSRLPARLPLA